MGPRAVRPRLAHGRGGRRDPQRPARTRAAARALPGCGLELDFDAAELRIRARVADTSDGRDTVALVRAGVLRGLSVEFRPDDERLEDGVRIVTRARLSGIAVVDDGAYDTATVNAYRARARDIGQTRGPSIWW